MSDPNDQTTTDSTQPLTGVTATGDAGATAASTTEQPASPGEAPAPATATGDNAVKAEDPMPSGTGVPPAPSSTPPAAHTFDPDVAGACRALDEIERIALFWGGDRGAQIRNQTTLARLALTGHSHNE